MAYSSTDKVIVTPGDQIVLLAFTGPAPGYLDRSHLILYINDVLGSSIGASLTFSNDTTVQIVGYTTEAGDKIKIRRETPKDEPLVDFTDGATVTEHDLDTVARQLVYIQHEIFDGYNTVPAQTNIDFGGNRGVNAGDPIDPQDLVTKLWAETALSAELAQAIAAKVAAELARDAAQASQAAAATSESNAAGSAAAASTSEGNAAASESAAAASEAAAQSSEEDALLYSTAALGAKNSAEAAQAAAESAESGAQTAESNAAASAAAALVSENAAQSSEDDAETAQAAAELAKAQTEALLAGVTSVIQSTARQAVLSFGGGLQAESTLVTGYDSVDYVGTGIAGLVVDLGMDFATGEHGGMVMVCDPPVAGNRIAIDTINGGYLGTNSTNALNTNLRAVFTATGYNAEVAGAINAVGGDHNVLAFNTTNIVSPETTAKSVTFDCADNYGYVGLMGSRSIEFLAINGSPIPLVEGVDFVAYATSQATGREVGNVFDTTKSKTGSSVGTSWLSGSGGYANQRLTIVFTTPVTFYGIRVNNYHHTGGDTTAGIKTAVVQITDDTLTQLQGETYGDTSGNLKQYLATQLYEHPATDTVADQDYKAETWHINPATGFGMCKVENQSDTQTIIHPMGKKPVQLWAKSLTATTHWSVYSDKIDYDQKLELDTSNATQLSTVWDQRVPTESEIYFNTSSEQILYGWFGDDLGDLYPGMTGVRGYSACVHLDTGYTFDSGISDPETILYKPTASAGSWYVMSKDRGWDKYTNFDKTDPEGTFSEGPTVVGSVVSIPAAWSTGIVMVFGKTGNLPTGKSLQIKATVADPFVATISDGFLKATGQKDIPVGHDVDVVYPQTEADGEYDIVLNPDGSLDLVAKDSYVTDFGPTWKNTKLLLGSCTISDGLIVDIDEVAVGDVYTTPWFPVVPNTVYVLPNLLRTPDVLAKLQYVSNTSASNSIIIDTQRSYDGTKFRGGHTAIIVDGKTIKVTTNDTLTPSSAVTGYYRMIVRRNA